MSDDPPAEKPDPIRNRLQECAGLCLDHIRGVRWGKAVSSYSVDDGDLRVQVFIEVSCLTMAEKKESRP